MKGKIWTDRHFLKYLALAGFLIILVFAYISAFKENNIDVYLLLLSLFPLAIFVNILRNKTTYITNGGIRIGNMPTDVYDEFRLNEVKFIHWTEIKEIKIINRVVRHGWFSVLATFLLIKTKNNKKYECFIANPKGFIEILRKMKKDNLITKDSKSF